MANAAWTSGDVREIPPSFPISEARLRPATCRKKRVRAALIASFRATISGSMPHVVLLRRKPISSCMRDQAAVSSKTFAHLSYDHPRNSESAETGPGSWARTHPGHETRLRPIASISILARSPPHLTCLKIGRRTRGSVRLRRRAGFGRGRAGLDRRAVRPITSRHRLRRSAVSQAVPFVMSDSRRC